MMGKVHCAFLLSTGTEFFFHKSKAKKFGGLMTYYKDRKKMHLVNQGRAENVVVKNIACPSTEVRGTSLNKTQIYMYTTVYLNSLHRIFGDHVPH